MLSGISKDGTLFVTISRRKNPAEWGPLSGYEDKAVNEAAAVALGPLGDARAVEPLIRAIDSWYSKRDWTVRREAATTVSGLAGKEAFQNSISMFA